MNWMGVPISAVCLLASGCASSLDFLQYDNPRVRKLQAAQLERFLPEGADQDSVLRFFAPRVGLIVVGDPKKPNVGSGRAAAISGDGYYLTANHVIGDQPFFLEETTMKKGLEEGIHIMSAEQLDEMIETRSYRGRVVWRNKDLDLAVVKFPKRTPSYFRSISGNISKGATVYSADDSGLGVIVQGGTNSGDIIGNGPFLVAGTVNSVERSRHLPDDHMISTDVVVRGGMSGTPLASRDGTLRGIILHINVNRHAIKNRNTIASIISQKNLRAILASDRAGRTPK